MRTHLLVPVFGSLFVFGCAGSASHGLDNVGEDDMPLSSYDSVFKGAPSNHSLPVIDLKADQIAARSNIKAGMANPDFSEQYLQWSVKKQLGAFADSEGSDNQDNVEALAQLGGVEESVWPYNGNEWGPTDDADCKPDGSETQSLPTKCWTQGEPPAAAATATKNKLPSGSWLSTKSIKQHITMDHTAVVVGIDFFYQAWNHGLSTLPNSQDDLKMGIVRYPNSDDVTESHKQRAGHGILLVGWDDNLEFPAIDKAGQPVKDAQGNPVMQKGFYIFKNSWGTSRFGVNNPNGAGYGYIQYQYVEQYGSAYTTTAPVLDNGGGGSPTTCDYKCSDYSFTAGQCCQGWQCDAQGQCLSYVGSCN